MVTTTVQGWTAIGVAALLSTVAPFQKNLTEKLFTLGAAAGMSTVALAIGLSHDPRKHRRQTAGELLVSEASYVGLATEQVKRPQPILISPTAAQLPQAAAIDRRDLTAEIARYDGHVLIASRTRSGKSTSIQSAIAHAYQHYQGNIEFFVFDPKGAAWCGLQAFEQYYLLCNTEQLIQDVVARLSFIITKMEARQRARVASGGHWSKGNEPSPIVVILDEFNTLMALAKNAGKLDAKIKSSVERLIFQGAEDKVFTWLMSQTTRVENLSLNTSVQDNMAYFAQSRNGDYQSVEDAIANSYVVSSSSERKRLQETLNQHKADTKRDRSIPIAFTTLGGNQLCLLPDLRDAAQKEIVVEVETKSDPILEELETLKRSLSLAPSHQERRFTRFNLPREEAIELINEYRRNRNQTETISILWGAKPGNNKPYQQAREEYRELMGE